MIEYITIFILSCIVLVWAGGRTVKSLSRISRILGWREFIVASLVMALGSSLPELFVAITASISKKPQLSVGNVLGSNIVALTLVIAIGTFLAGSLKFEKRIIQKSTVFASLYILLPLLLMMDRNLSRIDGVILIAALLLYVRELVIQQKRFSKPFNHLELSYSQKIKTFLKEVGIFFASLFLLLLSSEGIVFSAASIASGSNITLIVIGILGIALGTSLPEITFAFRSIKMGYKEMILGDAMGSVVMNSGLILGLTALISPFEIQKFPLYLNGIIFSAIVAIFFYIFARTKNEITKKEALVLLFIYLLFFTIEFLMEAYN